MSEHNSPMYALGLEHGRADTARIASCPVLNPVGPAPPVPAYRVMYDRGYQAGFDPGALHIHTAACRLP